MVCFFITKRVSFKVVGLCNKVKTQASLKKYQKDNNKKKITAQFKSKFCKFYNSNSSRTPRSNSVPSIINFQISKFSNQMFYMVIQFNGLDMSSFIYLLFTR